MIQRLAIADYGILFVYLAAVLGIGWWFHAKKGNTENYLMGGRRVPWWLAGISYMVTLVSTLSLVGCPGEAYKNGLTAALWPFMSLFLSVACFFIFVRFYFQTDTFTPFEYLERRFGPTCRTVTATLYCIARGIYLSTVLFAAAKVFEHSAGFPLLPTLLVIGVVCILCTAAGGLQAVLWTEFLQFFILIGGIGIIVWKAVSMLPMGPFEVFSYAAEHDHLFPEFKQPEFWSFSPMVRLTIWAILFRAIGDNLFYKSADQLVLQRLLSTSSYRQAFYTTLFGSLLAPTTIFVLYYVGLCMFAYYNGLPSGERPASDEALFRFITSELPSPLPGLIVAAMMAAVMSTVESGINSLATVLTKDFYARFSRNRNEEKSQLRFSVSATYGIGAAIVLFSMMIAVLADSVGGTVLESSGIWMSFLLIPAPVFLLGVFSLRLSERSAILSMALGCVLTVAAVGWYYTMKSYGYDCSFHVAAVSGFLGTLVFALIFIPFDKRRDERFLRNNTFRTLCKKSGNKTDGDD